MLLDGDLFVFGQEPLVSLIDSVEESTVEVGLLVALLAGNRSRLVPLFERVLYLHCHTDLARGVGLIVRVGLVAGRHSNRHNEALTVILHISDARHDMIHALCFVLQLARAPFLVMGRSLGSLKASPLQHSPACHLVSKLAAADRPSILQAHLLR